jgi:hypothetical protein
MDNEQEQFYQIARLSTTGKVLPVYTPAPSNLLT